MYSPYSQPLRYSRAETCLRRSPAWLVALADRAQALVTAPNGDEWPVTLKQLKRCASRFGCFVDLSTEAPFDACCADNIILVRRTGDDLRDYPRVVHELVERVVCLPILPELRTPDARMPHWIAEICEHRHRAFLVHVERARQEAEERRRDRTRRPLWSPQMDLLRVKDLGCDPDFDD